MATPKRLALPCKIELGAFSSERVFRITLANGQEYQSLAPYLHFWNNENERLTKNQPAAGETMEGLIAALLIGKENGDLVVEIPDGEVVIVAKKIALRRPQEVDTNVPVGSGSH